MEQNLSGFREAVERMMHDPSERPFLVDGNPLLADAFLVGANPATRLNQSFWTFWHDQTGMDREAFMETYKAVRTLRGVRPRLERIRCACQNMRLLETNLFSLPTLQQRDLRAVHRRTEVFEFLFDSIRPRLIFIHSNEPVAFMEDATKTALHDMGPVQVSWREHSFTIVVRRGPLWRASYSDAESIGALLSEL